MRLHSSSPRQHMGAGRERPISLLGLVSIPVARTLNPFYTATIVMAKQETISVAQSRNSCQRKIFKRT